MTRFLAAILLLVLSLLHPRAQAQSPATYETYKKLLDQYDWVTFCGGRFEVRSNGKFGLLDSLGKPVLPVQYNSHADLNYALNLASGAASKIKPWDISSDYWAIPSPAYYKAHPFPLIANNDLRDMAAKDPAPWYLLFDKEGKTGVADHTGRWIIPQEYGHPSNYEAVCYPLLLLPEKTGRLTGAIDTQNKVVIPFRYERLWPDNDYIYGYLPDSLDIYTITGKLLRHTAYQNCKSFNGILLGQRFGSWAMLNSNGVPITYFKYDDFHSLGSSQYVCFEAGNARGVMDRNGKIIVEPTYTSIEQVGGSAYSASFGYETHTLFDARFRKIFAASETGYSSIGVTDIGGAPIIKDWILISHTRRNADEPVMQVYHIPTRKTYAGAVLATALNGKLMLEGNPNTKSRYTRYDATNAAEDAQWVSVTGKPFAGTPMLNNYVATPNVAVQNKAGLYGVMDTNMNWVLQPAYKYLQILSDSIYAVALNQPGDLRYQVINTQGKVLVTGLTEVPRLQDRFYQLRNEHFGIADYKFNIIIPPVYDETVYPQTRANACGQEVQTFITHRKEETIILAANGDTIVPPGYNSVDYLYQYSLYLLGRNDSFFLATEDGRLLPTRFKGYGAIASPFGDYIFKTNNQYGFINYYGDTVYTAQYDDQGSHLGNYWLGQKGMYSIISPTGKILATGLKAQPAWSAASGDSILDRNKALYTRVTGTSFKMVADHAIIPGYSSEVPDANKYFKKLVTTYKPQPKGVIINKQLKEIAQTNIYTTDQYQAGHFLLYPDSSGKRFSVLDTSSRYVIPFTTADSFWLAPALAIARKAHAQYLVFDLLHPQKPPDTTWQTDAANRQSENGFYYRLLGKSYASGLLTVYPVKNGWKVVNTQSGSSRIFTQPVLWHSEYDTVVVARGSSGKWGIANLQQGWVLPAEYDTIPPVRYETYMQLRKNGKNGIMHRYTYATMLPFEYDSIFMYTSFERGGFALVKKAGAFYVVDNRNNILSGPWQEASRYAARLSEVKVSNGTQWQNLYMNADETINSSKLEKEPYEALYVYQSDLFLFKENGKYGIYDTRLKKAVIPPQYQNIAYESYGFSAQLEENGKCTQVIYSEAGNEKFRVPCGAEINNHTAYWTITQNDQTTVIDDRGKPIISAGYTMEEFKGSGYTPLGKDGKPGSFKDWEKHAGYFIISKAGKVGLLSIQKKMVLAVEYDEIDFINDSTAIAQNEKGSCLLQVKAKTIVKQCFDELEYASDQPPLYFARKGTYWGIIDLEGNVLEDFKLTNIAQAQEAVKKLKSGFSMFR